MLTHRRWLSWAVLGLLAVLVSMPARQAGADDEPVRRYLYVAVPGVRDYLDYGGHGLLVFDIDNDYKFVKRITTGGKSPAGKPLNVKGICGAVPTGRIYISTIKQLMCLEIESGRILWERPFLTTGCDRMSITPDGKTIFLPSLEGPQWLVVDAENGRELDKIEPNSGAQYDRRAVGRVRLPGGFALAVFERGQHDGFPGAHRGTVWQQHPAVHRQRQGDTLLHERE